SLIARTLPLDRCTYIGHCRLGNFRRDAVEIRGDGADLHLAEHEGVALVRPCPNSYIKETPSGLIDICTLLSHIPRSRAASQSPGFPKAHRPSTAFCSLVGPKACGGMSFLLQV